jgi:hypothetical protein
MKDMKELENMQQKKKKSSKACSRLLFSLLLLENRANIQYSKPSIK